MNLDAIPVPASGPLPARPGAGAASWCVFDVFADARDRTNGARCMHKKLHHGCTRDAHGTHRGHELDGKGNKLACDFGAFCRRFREGLGAFRAHFVQILGRCVHGHCQLNRCRRWLSVVGKAARRHQEHCHGEDAKSVGPLSRGETRVGSLDSAQGNLFIQTTVQGCHDHGVLDMVVLLRNWRFSSYGQTADGMT